MVVAIIAAIAGVVGWVTVWALRAGERRIARTALVLALLAVASFFVAYRGLPRVLAAGASVLAVIGARREERWHAASVVALGLAAAALGLAILFAMVG